MQQANAAFWVNNPSCLRAVGQWGGPRGLPSLYPLSRVVRVRLTNLIRTHCLEKAIYPKQNTSVYVWQSNPGTNLGESFD
jgi:hypothetical protein